MKNGEVFGPQCIVQQHRLQVKNIEEKQKHKIDKKQNIQT